MKSSASNVQAGSSTIEKLEKIHPYLMLLYLGITGISLIFLFFIGSFTVYLFSENNNVQLTVPSYFGISTLLLVASSYYIQKAWKYFKGDQLKLVAKMLYITLGLGVSFCLFQFAGWMDLHTSGVYFSGKPVESFMYILSAAHILHLAGGMIYLLYMYVHINRKAKDPVTNLVTVTNPFEIMKLKMLILYWHFMDILWIAIFAALLLTIFV